MTNVDHAEIAKFEALAHRWWDRESEFKPLHDINPLRVNWINERAPLAGKKVLDVGCGGGILSEAMAQRGAQVMGIDMGEAPLAVARLHQLESGVEVEYRQITAETLAEEMPEQFDVVTCLEMLEHVPDPASIIRACYAMVKPGGPSVFLNHQSQPQGLSFCHCWCGIHHASVTAWHPRFQKIHSPFRIRRMESCGWFTGARHYWPNLQPAHQALQT